MNGRNLATFQCSNRAERNHRWLVEDDLQRSAERAFQAYGEPLETVTSFKYLGQVMTTGDDNWVERVGNLRKARKSLTRVTRILGS